MESKKRLYIVSFGESDEYRLEFDDVANTDAFHHTNPLNNLETELSDYLSSEFPGKTFTFLTTPKVTEVSYDNIEKYKSYPILDAKAIEEIKKVIFNEAEMKMNDAELNLNAPFAEV